MPDKDGTQQAGASLWAAVCCYTGSLGAARQGVAQIDVLLESAPMAQMRFRVHDRDRIPDNWRSRIYVAGPEEIPWSTRTFWVNDHLVVERSVTESGTVSVPWPVEGRPRTVLTTSTLMVREKPYQLEVELARGLIHRIRNRVSLWEMVGLEAGSAGLEKLNEATRVFARAATSQEDPPRAAELSEEAIARALEAGEQLAVDYAQRSIEARRKQGPIGTLMGVTLPPESPTVGMRRLLAEACNIVQLPVCWRWIEAREGRPDWKPTDDELAWCQTAGIKAIAGPLLRLDDHGAPDWMYLWEGDFDNLSRLVLDHITAVVKRYAGRVHLWHVASRVNSGTLLSLDEEQRLHLVAMALEVVHRHDPRTPTVVSFDQPWGEYLIDRDDELAPIHYADALVRADLGVSGFGLEIDVRESPGGTLHRPLFEFASLVDQWSLMGMPLMISVECAGTPADEAGSGTAGAADAQRDWAEAMLNLMLARTPVQVLLWNRLCDEGPRPSGLIDAQGNSKPALGLMRDLRKGFLL